MHEDAALAVALDEDVAHLVHLDLEAVANGLLDDLRLGVAHWVLEAIEPDPDAVEAVLGVVYRDHGGPGVSFGHPPVLLEDDHLRPDLVVDLLPLAEDLVDVILRGDKSAVFFNKRDLLKRVLNYQSTPVGRGIVC